LLPLPLTAQVIRQTIQFLGEGSMIGLTEANNFRAAPGDHLTAFSAIKAGIGALGIVSVSLLLALLQ